MPEPSRMKEPTRAELDILLAHLLRCPEVLQQAVTYLQVDDFDPAKGLKGHQVLYAVAMDFYREHRALPNCTMIYALVDSRVADPRNPELLHNPEMADSIKKLAYSCFVLSDDKDLIPAFALNIMESLVTYNRVVLPGIASLEQKSFGDMFETLVQESKRTILSRSAIVEPFGDTEMFGVTPREQTGVLFIDNMLGGGVRPSEVYGLIGPSGGGKTTLVNQIGLAYAARDRHFAIFQYEESPSSNEFMASVYACAAQIPRKIVESCKRPSDLTKEYRDRYELAKSKIRNNLHFVDMSGTVVRGAGNGGVPEIDATLHVFKSKGIRLSGIAIDWFLPMAKRCYNSAVKQVGKGGQLDERSHYNNVIDELKQVVGQHGLWCLVASQTAAAEAQKKKSEWNNAAENKAMAWLMHGFFTLSALDTDEIGEFNLSKGRRQKKTKIFIQLKGELATFVNLNDDMRYDERQGKHVVKGKEHVIPTDKPAPAEKTKDMANMEGVELA